MTIGIFYGSTTGNTSRIAADLVHTFAPTPISGCWDVATIQPSELLRPTMLILGIPTWHVGEVQDDWALLLPKLEHLNFTGKKIALFGLGDANGYPDTFADALAEVWTCFRQAGAQLVGTWPTTDYTFTASRSLIEPDRFLGLVLDEDNEPGQTPERLQAWVQQLRHELAL